MDHCSVLDCQTEDQRPLSILPDKQPQDNPADQKTLDSPTNQKPADSPADQPDGPERIVNIMDPNGQRLIAIIDESLPTSAEVGLSLQANFEAINLKEEEQEDDAEFDEILHRRKLEDPDWGGSLYRRRLDAPEVHSKVNFLPLPDVLDIFFCIQLSRHK
jgi:hypothetical protein